MHTNEQTGAYIAEKATPIKAAPNVFPRSTAGNRFCVEEDIDIVD